MRRAMTGIQNSMLAIIISLPSSLSDVQTLLETRSDSNLTDTRRDATKTVMK